MSTLPIAEPGEGPKARRPEHRAATIVRAVMDSLGRPAEFLKATVRPVVGDRYRVNVVTGPDAASARIAHSFFVTADEDGNVLASFPAIVRLYQV